MIQFQSLIQTILKEAKEDFERQGNLTGKSFTPKGYSGTSAIRGIGLYNREKQNRWEYGNAPKEQTQSNSETIRAQKDLYKKINTIFGLIIKDSNQKQHVEDIISDYMTVYQQAQAARKALARNANYFNEERYKVEKGQKDEDGVIVKVSEKDIAAASNYPIENGGWRGYVADMPKGIPKPTEFDIDRYRCEQSIEELRSMEDSVYDAVVDYAVEVTTQPILLDLNRQIEEFNKTAEEPVELKTQDDVEQRIRMYLENWKEKKNRDYETALQKNITDVAKGGYFGFTTPVSSVATWLQNATVVLGQEQAKAAENIVKFNSSKSVVGELSSIPEGAKVKRLLDIVDEVTHKFSQDAESTSRFATEKDKEKSFRNSKDFSTLREEAYGIVSDLGGILGSAQFELFKLVTSFFNDEEGSEGALKRFVINDVVNTFNS